MKVNRKNRQNIHPPQAYINYLKLIFDLSRKQSEIVPSKFGFELTISDQMLELTATEKPHFYQGASCSEDRSLDQTFAESLGMDLHYHLSSNR
jgi:hypothetical protein